MIVNNPAVDYLRMTTFDFGYYETGVRIMAHKEREWQRGAFMQYRGNRADGLFHGQGDQGGKTHYIAEMSGEVADDYASKMLQTGMGVTRIDLQITVPVMKDWNVRRETDELRETPWPNRMRTVTAIDNNGNDTIYIGARTSERFIRFYVKESEWLRFEIEFKGDLAKLAANQVRIGHRQAIAGILLSELNKLPETRLTLYFEHYLLGYDHTKANLRVEKVEPDKIRQMKWLASLLPTIERMMSDHDYGHTVVEWFEELVQRHYQRKEGGHYE